MTELLQQVIAEVSKLSDEQQDVIASCILAELEDEQVWHSRFEATKDAQWDNASQLRCEIINHVQVETYSFFYGKTIVLDVNKVDTT